MNAFILIGEPDPNSDDNLYWSNNFGWNTRENATIFPMEILSLSQEFYPIGTRGILEVFPNNQIGTIIEISLDKNKQ